jgi:hypothetical protein
MWQDVLGWFDDHGGGISAIAAVATGVIAIVTLIRAGSDSRKRSQPMVLAELRPAKDSDSVIDLVVRNAGTTVARNVKVTFDPVIEVPAERAHEPLVTPSLVQRYATEIPTLAPAQELSNIYWAGEHGSGSDLTNREPTHDRVTVTVEYSGLGWWRLRDSFVLDVKVVTLTTWSESSNSMIGRVRAIASALDSISKAAHKR